jgi:RNA polymerase sigma factor (sigma-70 family)
MTENSNLKDRWLYWYPKVYSYFYKRVGIKFEVEELTANTLYTVFLAKNVLNFQAYTWRVAHNYLVKYINTKSTEVMFVNLDPNIVDSKEINPAIDLKIDCIISDKYAEKLKDLKLCIKNHLKKDMDIKLISLCIYEEKTSTEVAKVLNLKAENVRQKLSRTIKKLRLQCRELWFKSKSNTI